MSRSAIDKLRMQGLGVNATGAAAGIGRGIFEALPDAGAAVVASDLVLAHADDVVQSICAAGGQAIEAPIEVGLDRSGALSAPLAPPTRPVMLRPG